MKKLISPLIPLYLKILWNQYINSKKFDVKFGDGAKAFNCVFEGKNFVNSNTSIFDSFVGLGTYFAGNSKIQKVKIGRFCSIGRDVQTGFGIHPTHFISTHPAFYSTKKQAGFTFAKKQIFKEHKLADTEGKYYVVIGNDVWIGSDVKIMDGITIGDGAIIATGAIVTRNILPYTINGGIPSHIIRKRFDDCEIEFLLKYKWWNKSTEEIEQDAPFFLDASSFFKRYSTLSD